MVQPIKVAKTNPWSQAWASPAYAPEKLLVALMLLNGLSAQEIQVLGSNYVDLSEGWLTTAQGKYPLVQQVHDCLSEMKLDSNTLFAEGQVAALLNQHHLSQEDAQRKLAGALWITSEDTQLISTTSGVSEAPILPLQFTFPFSVVERLQSDPASEVAQRSRHVLQDAADWLEGELLVRAPVVPLRQRLARMVLEGKTVFLVASTGVNGINMLFNLVMGRLLPPAAYSQLALLVTLHLVIGLLPTAAQTAIARFSAIYVANGDLAAVIQIRREGSRLMWGIGIVLALLLLATAAPLARLFQLDSPILLVPLAIGTTFYVSMSVDRGVLQGLNGFYWLAASYLSESVVRFIISVAFGLILVGTASRLQGGAWAVGESMIATWFIGWLALRHLPRLSVPPKPDALARRQWLRLAGLTLVALIGQALIANSDFLLVKSLFNSEESGLYAAVSILGRIVYFGALPLTIVLVPFIARKQALGEPTRPTLFLMLGGGALFCGAALLGAFLFSSTIMRVLYGEAYTAASGLLAVYTLAASLYVLTNLVITYRVALGRGGETWLPLVAGGLQVIGILLFHGTLMQVILVQVALMGLLLVVTLWRGLRAESA